MDYSIVIPVFNEDKSLSELSKRISAVFKEQYPGKSYEIIFIDDGSTDDSRRMLLRLHKENPYIRYIFFRKNLGKAFALMAGFLRAQGSVVLTMDGDLQDRPEDIPILLGELEKGFDVVSGWKQERRDTQTRILGSWLFNQIVSQFGHLHLHDINCGFKAYRAKVVKSLAIYGQHHRFIPLLAHFSGFRIGEARIGNDPRKFGVSKYPTFRYQGFLDLFSILFAYKYRFSPLHFFGTLGSLLFIPGFIIAAYLMYRHALFVLGLGDNYMKRITLLLPLVIIVSVIGVNIFLTGFICDFMLCHQHRNESLRAFESLIENESEGMA